MKPTRPLQENLSEFATTPSRGISLSRVRRSARRMNRSSILALLLLAATLGACASRQPAYCTAEPFEIKLSLRHRDVPALHLVAIEKSQRVILRDEFGDFLSARPGEEFVRRDSTETNWKLKSVDLT